MPQGSATPSEVPLWLCAPFALLLLLIAMAPLAPPGPKRPWERGYPLVSILLALSVGAGIAAMLPEGISLLGHTIREYISFISLIGALFVVAGGIHVEVTDEATPRVNIAFLLLGAVLANVVGTTGASMVLIRPWLRMNRSRISAYHIVFFIFIVSNVGGVLTPVGDPPLFIGYLRGVPFFWLLPRAFVTWTGTITMLLLVFYFFDRSGRGTSWAAIRPAGDRTAGGFRIEGKLNLLWLVFVVGAVFLPERFFLREIVMLASAFASYRLTAGEIHTRNAFSFGPIREVAFLFIGIFVTMMPALAYLDRHGRDFSLDTPRAYFLASGSLSSVLDNAPTYATFLQLAQARVVAEVPGMAGMGTAHALPEGMLDRPYAAALLVAISLGSVFFGAMTYIGNGPNFMVKAIADSAGVRTPSFFGYIFKYSVPILLPILLLVGWISF